MTDLKTNEGVVNNSNQPSQNNKLQELINNKISQLTEQLSKIGNEINELKTIEVSDEVQKMVVGSTEFKIEDFMSEPDIQKYRNWLEVKKELEGFEETDVDDLVDEQLDDKWNYDWEGYIEENCDYRDFDPWDYMEFNEFIERYLDSSDYSLEGYKDDYKSNFSKTEILEEYIKDNV